MSSQPNHEYTYQESITVTANKEVRIESRARVVYQQQQQLQHLSPFPFIIQDFLTQFSASRILLQASSKATSSSDELYYPAPSGVFVQVEWLHSNSSKDEFYSLLQQLQKNRLFLAPLDSITQQRLHRHVFNNQTTSMSTMSITLPMEGSTTMSSEGINCLMRQSPCHSTTSQLGIWHLAPPKEYAHKLSLVQGSVSMQRRHRSAMWIEMLASPGCFSRQTCQMQHSLGITYGYEQKGVQSPLLSQLLPGTSFQSCPFVKETEVYLPDLTVLALTGDTPYWNMPLWKEANAVTLPTLPTLTLTKTVLRPKGIANSGTLQTIIRNNANVTTDITLLDFIPTTYLHPKWTSLQLHGDGIYNMPPTFIQTKDGTVEMTHYLQVAPLTTLTLSLDYLPILLNFQLFPADPNRGIELPPSIVVMHTGTTLYSNSLLLQPPVPDMSMPFNVMSLTCTIYVFVIGSMVNMLVKRASDRVRQELDPMTKKSTVMVRLLQRWKKAQPTTPEEKKDQ